MTRRILAATILTLGVAALAAPAAAEMGFNTVHERRLLERQHAEQRMAHTQQMLHDLKAAREAAIRNSDRIQAAKNHDDNAVHDTIVWDYSTNTQVADNETPVQAK